MAVLLSSVLYTTLVMRRGAKEALLMLFMVRPDTKSVTMLADILETIEVTADELLDQRFAPDLVAANTEDGDARVQARLSSLRQFVDNVRDLEICLLNKLEQARVRARTVARSDWRLRPIMSLFTAGTQALADHIASPQGRIAMRFDGTDQIFSFLRSRELLAPAAEHYDGASELLVTDSFRLLGLIKLRDLMERCEVALNALDAHYDLYDWPSDEASQPAEAQVVEFPVANGSASTVQPAAETPAEAAVAIDIPGVVEAAEPAVAEPPAASVQASETASPAITPAVDWGNALPAAPEAIGAETEASPAVAAEAVANSDTEVATVAEPAADEIAEAEAAAEDGLKSLTERLSELRAAEPPAAAAAPDEAALVEPTKSDAA